MAHTHNINPSYLRGGDEEGYSLGSAQAKSAQDPISAIKKLGMVVCACHPSSVGSENRRIEVQTNPGINVRPYLKKNGSKKDRRRSSSDRAPAQQAQAQYPSFTPKNKINK
jgi:hypothetical protein